MGILLWSNKNSINSMLGHRVYLGVLFGMEKYRHATIA